MILYCIYVEKNVPLDENKKYEIKFEPIRTKIYF